jgi:hypothetical protein
MNHVDHAKVLAIVSIVMGSVPFQQQEELGKPHVQFVKAQETVHLAMERG